MNWLNIKNSFLRAPEYIGCEPTARATWLNVLSYSTEQENGGRIVGARKWKDRQWQQTCGVTVAEVDVSSPLLTWDGDDLVVWNYPTEKEAEVRVKREAGKVGGGRSGKSRAQGKPSTPPSTDSSSASRSASSSASTEGEREGEGEGKKKEKKPRERGGDVFDSLPGELNTAAFREAWERFLAYRRKMRFSKLQPESVASKWRAMAAWGVTAAIAQIEESIQQQWQGIFAPKGGTKVIPVPIPVVAPPVPKEAFKTIQDLAAERRAADEKHERELAGET